MLQRLGDVRVRHRDDALQRGVNPRDVDVLLSDLLGKPLSWLFSHGETELDPAPLQRLLLRRYAGEPLQYIRRKADFYSREFYVDERVLIPRPETELLVETALERAPRGGHVLDVGAGSGCIAISIQLERPDLRVTSLDRSVDALAVAALNKVRLGAGVSLMAADLLSSVRGRFDVIASNPPYVPASEYEELAIEVRVHEPRMAITPGPSGTEIIERILRDAHALLAPKGVVILEVGYGQETSVRTLARRSGYDVDAFLPDLAGIPRTVVLSEHA
jgi:release factor glutamine methyltransferase